MFLFDAETAHARVCSSSPLLDLILSALSVVSGSVSIIIIVIIISI